MVKMTVDAMGDHCPIPVVKTKKALGKLQGAGQIEVLVDNETAMKNVMKMAKRRTRLYQKAIKKDRPQEKKAGRRQKAGGKKQANRITIRQQKMEVTVVRRG